jgi:peptide/nickel transport system permease protein
LGDQVTPTHAATAPGTVQDERQAKRRRGKPRHLAALIAAVVLAGLILIALVGPWLGLDPAKQDLINSDLPPYGFEGAAAGHVLGTDDLGRDILARVVHGMRTSILVSFAAVLIGAVVGVSVGVSAGYLRGRFDDFIMRVVDVQQSIPSLLMVIVLVTIFRPSITTVVCVLALSAWDVFARVARSQVLSLRENDFVTAIRALGATPMRIVLSHILPNIAGPLILIGSLEMATLIIAESALSYLGFGIPPPAPSLGGMISVGQVALTAGIWWPVLVPGTALCLLIISINVLGDWARDTLDPRSTTER